MTFHTFELSYRISMVRYFKVCETIREKYSSKFFPDRANTGRWIFTGLEGAGIIICFSKHTIYDEYSEVKVFYRINPVRLLHSGDYLNLFHSNDVGDLFDLIDERLSEVANILPKVREGTLVRFDFCSNIVMENPSRVKDWIYLLNRAFIPAGKYKQKKVFNKRAGRYELPDNEATFTFERQK